MVRNRVSNFTGDRNTEFQMIEIVETYFLQLMLHYMRCLDLNIVPLY